MTGPKITWTVSTYGRPKLLSRIVHCFEQQDYENRYMVIVDDGGQFANQEGDRWRLLSLKQRFVSLGAKRNYVLTLVPPDTDAVCPVDDDDLVLPWHTAAAAACIEKADWSRPSVIVSLRYVGGGISLFLQNHTGKREDQTQQRLYHPSWCISLDAIRFAGGYPDDMSGPEDQELMHRMEAAGTSQADQIDLGWKPSYCYIWGNQNISGLLTGDPRGERAWASLRRDLTPATLEPWEPPFDLHNPPIIEGVLPRPF